MKLYIITIDEVYDMEQYGHDPIPYIDKEAAVKKFRRIVKEAKKEFKNDFDKSETIKDESFIIWKEGCYSTDHYRLSLHECEIAPSFRLQAVFGEQAVRTVGNVGFDKAHQLAEKGDIDGSFNDVVFDTEEDRRKAIELVDLADGWLDTCWQIPKEA